MENNDFEYNGFVRNIQVQSSMNGENSTGNTVKAESQKVAEPVFVEPEKIEKPKDNKKMKRILIIILVVVYTAVVSFASIEIYKAVLRKRMTNAFENIWSDSFDIDDKDTKSESKSEKTPKAKSVSMNKMFNVNDIFEVTLFKSAWKESVDSKYATDDGYYYNYDDKDNETYFVVSGKIKNVSGQTICFDENIHCKLTVNDKYTVHGFIAADIKNGGLEDDYYIKPLEEVEMVFIVSVSDEMYKSCKDAKLTMSFIKDEDSINSFLNDNFVDYEVALKN